MVGQQGWNLWSGECAIILGEACRLSAKVAVLCLSRRGLGFRLCGWLLLDSSVNQLPLFHTSSLGFSLLALGTPLSWKKTVLSEINTWLGFVITLLSRWPERNMWLFLLYSGTLPWVFSCKAIEKALGRIQWATATCPLAKPFLQPFWQWKSACKTAGQPGKLVRCLAVLLSELFSDASAESFGSTWIGGWLSDLQTPAKDQVYWFQYQVTEDLHPWAFKRNGSSTRSCLQIAHSLGQRQPA